MRILGIDYGIKKIGLAVGVTDVKIATPLTVISNSNNLLDLIIKFIADEGIKEVVVGRPLGDSQSMAEQQDGVDHFVNSLNDVLDIPIKVYEEGYTSSEAKRMMQESGLRGEDDAIAAMLMLQRYLDSL